MSQTGVLVAAESRLLLHILETTNLRVAGGPTIIKRTRLGAVSAETRTTTTTLLPRAAAETRRLRSSMGLTQSPYGVGTARGVRLRGGVETTTTKIRLTTTTTDPGDDEAMMTIRVVLQDMTTTVTGTQIGSTTGAAIVVMTEDGETTATIATIATTGGDGMIAAEGDTAMTTTITAIEDDGETRADLRRR